MTYFRNPLANRSQRAAPIAFVVFALPQVGGDLGPESNRLRWVMEKNIVNWQLLIPLLVTTVVAVSGWVVGHRLNAQRDLQNKRIELRIKYLLEAYRNLESSVETEVSRKNLDILESAISDIQLLGTPEQVDKVLSWSSQFSKVGIQKDVNLQDLLEDLRTSLRRELGLPKIDQKIRHVKFTLASDAKKTLRAE